MDVLHLHSPPVITTKVPLHPLSSEVLGEVGREGGLVIPISGSSSDMRMVFVRSHGCPHPISRTPLKANADLPLSQVCLSHPAPPTPADWKADQMAGSGVASLAHRKESAQEKAE